MSVIIWALIGRVTIAALKLPRSVVILPPEVEPTAAATEGFGVAEGSGVTDGLGVGVGVEEGEGLGEGEGNGDSDGEGEGVKNTDGEGEGFFISCLAV